MANTRNLKGGQIYAVPLSNGTYTLSQFIDHAKAIMRRLEKEGVKFPIPKLPTDYFEEKTDSLKIDDEKI